MIFTGLVYVGQGEMVVGVVDDRKIDFFGSEDATTCHVIILRQDQLFFGKNLKQDFGLKCGMQC